MSLHQTFRVVALLCFAACLAVGVAGCSDPFGPDERMVVMDVAPRTVSCMGGEEGLRECLQVRWHPDTSWTFFYDGIAGFDYEAGFDYTVAIAMRRVLNPPADGSSHAFRLLAILRMEPHNPSP